MLMAIMWWVGIISTLIGIGYIAYKLADRIDKEEKAVLEWERFIQSIEQTEPLVAQYLRWLRDEGRTDQYNPFLVEQLRQQYGNQYAQNAQGYAQGYQNQGRQW